MDHKKTSIIRYPRSDSFRVIILTSFVVSPVSAISQVPLPFLPTLIIFLPDFPRRFELRPRISHISMMKMTYLRPFIRKLVVTIIMSTHYLPSPLSTQESTRNNRADGKRKAKGK